MKQGWSLSFAESFLAGILAVYLLGGVLRPVQDDFAHTIGVLTARGGVVVHDAHLEMGREFLGSHTLFLTATAAPPVGGDIRVEMAGPAPLEYRVTGRYPPTVPLLNGLHPWYRLERDTLRGVVPGDSIILTVRMNPPRVPGAYTLVMSDAQSGRAYLSLPVHFAPSGEGSDRPELPSLDCPSCR